MLRRTVVFVFLLLTMIATGVSAQENVVATGLNGPRGMSYDAEGNLFIAEAGTGGTLEVETPFGIGTLGNSAQITLVDIEGTQSAFIPGLPSVNLGMESLGVASLYATEDLLWVVFSESVPVNPLGWAVVAFDRETLRIRHFIDLYTYEVENNPDGSEEIYNNPNDIVIDGEGKLWIVDTGANTIYNWTGADGLQVWKSWSDNPVPSSIALAPNGDVVIGFLGRGIAPGEGHVDRYDAAGNQLETFGGLTGVTDIAIDAAGNLYAVQLYTAAGEEGPDVTSGSVVQLTADGAVPVAEGLYTPYGLVVTPDGGLLVSTSTAFADPGTGQVLRIR